MMTEQKPVGAGDHVILVDGSSFVFRAYFQSMRQDQRYNYRSDRLPTGAVRLFATKLFQFVREGVKGRRATHLGIIFDKSEDSFRRELYPDYKANRSEPPDELVPQFPLMRVAVRAFGLTPIEQSRYEADDLIATYACEACRLGADVTIVSADKDLMQLIRPGITMYDPASGEAGKAGSREERLIGEAEVIEHFGVPPGKVVEVQALAGDSTDNVPGAPGIGIKTAAQLIAEYGDLDTLLARAHEIRQPKRRETLTDPAVVEKVRLSRKLVELDCEVPLEVPLASLAAHDPPAARTIAFLKAMEFTTLTRRIAEAYEIDAAEIEADASLASPLRTGQTAAAASPEGTPGSAGTSAPAALSPRALVERLAATARATPVDRSACVVLASPEALSAWLDGARESGLLALAMLPGGPDPMTAAIVGIGLASAPGRTGYVPLQHGSADGLFGEAEPTARIAEDTALALLKPVLEAPDILKIGQNIKLETTLLARRGVALAPADDVMLMSYVLDAGRAGHGRDDLSREILAHTPQTLAELTGKGKAQLPLAQVDIAAAAAHAGEAADIALRIWQVLRARLIAEGMRTPYETLERPMPTVLSAMERRGIAIDRAILSRLSGTFAQAMGALEAEIHELAGEPFNLGSPKQLGDILFGRMGLPGARKTATGAWSTTAQILEELAEQGHLLPARILDWRQMSKLKSTYTDALPGYVNAETGRVHTSYALAATTTGRLSSSEPNLQNIPVRNEMGRQIRTAFVATPGHKLVSADYSQIELRILAHIADIPQLKAAFADGLDIHAMTASEMFGVPMAQMTGDIRRRAKAINFGIIYGISAFGLANQLGIAREEAGQYIRTYFERFPGIRDYMETTKRFAKDNGYVRTLFGRKCHYPMIASKNPSERAFMERAAINAPIQGSAADIIRRAMVRMDAALAREKLSARMLLQVHDELIFEVAEDEVEATIPVVRKVMADAALPAVALSVPLQVDARAAGNWDEAH